MKRQIRINTFETNSSSTHTLIIAKKSEYEKFKSGELYLDRYYGKFYTKEEIINMAIKNPRYTGSLDDMEDILDFLYDIDTCDRYFNDDYLETYERSYTSESGDEIVIFGKYGYDG